MKIVPLTQGKVALVDDEDYERVIQFHWYANKGRYTWYARNMSLGYLHNFILGANIDHRNGDGLNNQKFNLRFCSQSQNNQNARKRSNTSSQFKGVSFYQANYLWAAYINIGIKKHLGYYNTEQEAAKAYNIAALQYFGKFAKLNKL